MHALSLKNVTQIMDTWTETAGSPSSHPIDQREKKNLIHFRNDGTKSSQRSRGIVAGPTDCAHVRRSVIVTVARVYTAVPV